MNNIHVLKNAKFLSRIFCSPRNVLHSNVKQYSLDSSCKVLRSSYFKATSVRQERFISNCNSMQTKGTDAMNSNDDSEKMQKVLEDEEFQSILKDFANDFCVDTKTNDLQILEEIRKDIEKNYEESNLSSETVSTDRNAFDSSLGGGLDGKYKEFSDADASTIYSYEDEQVYHIDHELKPKTMYDNLQRGIQGVFDIDDMIQLLRNESLFDIATIALPTDRMDESCQFLVLVTAKSQRHIEAIAESIKKIYKMKRSKSDPFVIVEGADSSGWKVMDMGNIILHIFLEEVRDKYDIESCQLLDLQFDSGGNAPPDPTLKVFEEQMEFFNSLHNSNSTEASKDMSGKPEDMSEEPKDMSEEPKDMSETSKDMSKAPKDIS